MRRLSSTPGVFGDLLLVCHPPFRIAKIILIAIVMKPFAVKKPLEPVPVYFANTVGWCLVSK